MKNFYKTLFAAFFLSILLHYVLFFTLEKTLQHEKLHINTTTTKQDPKKNGLVQIKYVKVVPKETPKKEKKGKEKKEKENLVEKKAIVKPVEKATPKKEQKKKEIVQKTIPIKKTPVPIVKQEPLDLKKFFTIDKENTNTQEMQNNSLQVKQQEKQALQNLSELTQSYIKLYGEKYFAFSKEQKSYLKENLSRIGQITQRYLEYPNISIRTKQQGVNIVQFFLHPNGDITDLKLTDSSHYTALDNNSLETIRLAYQDYPRPLEKVLIKIYVKYRFY